MDLCFTVNANNPNVQRYFPGIRKLFNQNIVLSRQEIVAGYATQNGSGLVTAHRFEEELAWTVLSLVQKQFLHILHDDNTTQPGVHIYRYTTPHTLQVLDDPIPHPTPRTKTVIRPACPSGAAVCRAHGRTPRRDAGSQNMQLNAKASAARQIATWYSSEDAQQAITGTAMQNAPALLRAIGVDVPDVNGNGRIDPNEIIAYLTEHPDLAQQLFTLVQSKREEDETPLAQPADNIIVDMPQNGEVTTRPFGE